MDSSKITEKLAKGFKEKKQKLNWKKCITNKRLCQESNLNHLPLRSTPRQLNHAAVISVIYKPLLQEGLYMQQSLWEEQRENSFFVGISTCFGILRPMAIFSSLWWWLESGSRVPEWTFQSYSRACFIFTCISGVLVEQIAKIWAFFNKKYPKVNLQRNVEVKVVVK